MLKNFIENYYKLFDEKLKNWTIIVLIIAILIISVWNITNVSNKEIFVNSKTNLLENSIKNEIIILNGKTYRLIK